MVLSMPVDRGKLPRVACLMIFAGVASCGPRFRPEGPEGEPTPVIRNDRPHPAAANGRQIMVGEMCPTGAAGRPAVAPIALRTVQWTDKPEEISNTVERGATPRSVGFGVDGKPAGVFDTVGLADVGLAQPVASGAYTGGGPCAVDQKGTRVDDPKCIAAFGGCGLAVAELGRPDDLPETPKFEPGTICLAGDTLAVDIDGDHVVEAFALDQLLDGIRGPTAEWSANPTAAAACEGHFQLYGIPLDPKVDPKTGKADPKNRVTLDVLGVVDLDGDGRKELVLALQFATVQSIVVYSPVDAAQRLELVGEGPAFPH
jgi:hypothetical protein